MKVNPEKIYIEILWKYRLETLQTCAANYLSFLQKLTISQPTFFNTWYEKKEDLKDTLKHKVAYTHVSVEKTFSPIAYENGMTLAPYSAIYCNGKNPPKETILEVSLGMGEGADLFTNSCMITLPTEGSVYDFYKNPSHLLTLMKLMIAHWKPTYIEMYNHEEEIDYPFSDKKLLEAIKKSFYT